MKCWWKYSLVCSLPSKKLDHGNWSQKIRKRTHPSFLILSNFTRFCHFVPNILPGIAGSEKYRKWCNNYKQYWFHIIYFVFLIIWRHIKVIFWEGVIEFTVLHVLFRYNCKQTQKLKRFCLTMIRNYVHFFWNECFHWEKSVDIRKVAKYTMFLIVTATRLKIALSKVLSSEIYFIHNVHNINLPNLKHTLNFVIKLAFLWNVIYVKFDI